jgi:acetyltransferase-like isoleucine patch superfamily enzyme
MTYIRILYRYLKFVYSLLKFRHRFIFLADIRNTGYIYPSIEPLCDFKFTSRIFVSANVRFLRGAVVISDAIGSIKIGENSVICRYAIVQSCGGQMIIGKSTLIGDYTNLYAQGNLFIGDNVMLASGVRVIPNTHTFDIPFLSVQEQPSVTKGVEIKDGVWIGTNAVILDGVTIGEGAIIGAGSVVNHNVLPYEIVVGVPAKHLRMRPGH